MPFDPAAVRLPDPAELEGEGYRLRPTELGLASPGMQLGDDPQQNRALWQSLPPLYFYVEIPELKPGVRVLAEHPTRTGPDGRSLPLVCLQYVGSGKVLFHATDETWRWRYRLGDVLFARYWVQTIRFLARSKLATGRQQALLSTDQPDYRPGEPVRLRVQFVDPRSDLPPGRYHAWMVTPVSGGETPAVDFVMRAPAGEFERVAMDAVAMRRAAETTKGRYYDLASAERLLRDLPPGRQVPIETLPPRALWNRWPVLLVVLMLLIGEWLLRKAGGMV